MEYKLSLIMIPYTEKNTENKYEPVAVGKYGIRKRSDIYKKDLANDYSKNKVIYKDTLTIGLGSKQIDVGVLTEDAIYSVSPAYSTFKINTDIISPEYLALYFSVFNGILTQKYMIASARQGKKVDITNLLKDTIIVPDFDTQRRIVNDVSFIKEVKLKDEHLLELYDELVKARFVEMFGDPVSNPKGWQTKRFDSICENLDSRRKPITASEREAGEYPYYGASGIVDYVADYIFDEDILLVSEDGANLLMRSTPIAFSVSGKVWVNNHAHVVRFNDKGLQKYIEVFFSMIDISDQITGSAQPKLNQAKLNAMLFPIPDKKLTDSFWEFLAQVDKSRTAVQKRIELYTELLNKKMDEYFKGEVS